MNGVSAIVMASGLSRRMGGVNKLLLPVDGKPLIAHTLSLIASAPALTESIVVTQNPEIRALARAHGARCVENPAPQLGQSQSVRLGTAAASGDFYLFLPGDQPYLRPSDIALLIRMAETGRIVSPRAEGQPSSPTLFCASFRDELLALEGDNGGGALKRRYADRVDYVELPRETLRDIDNWDDYQALLQAFAGR